jgi:hypothetical protein
MKIDTKRKLGVLVLAVLLLPLFASAQVNNDIQNKSDYWCPKIEFVGKAAEIFKLDKCEYISGITIKLIYNGKYSYPSKLNFTFLDSQGNVMKEEQKKKVFGPQSLKKGQYGIFTIQNHGNDKPSKIRIEGIWKKK